MAEEISSSNEQQDLVFTRIFDAPVEKVWRAWTEPEQVMRWWGPDHFTSPSAHMDVREGGTSILCMRAPKEFGGQDMYSAITYQKVVPMEQIEFIHNLSDKDGNKVKPAALGMPPDFPQDQLQTVSFKDLGDNKTEITVKEFGWTPGKMMEMSQMGMDQCLNKMATSLATD